MKKIASLLIVFSLVAICMASDFKVDTTKFTYTLYMYCESCSHPTAIFEIPYVTTEKQDQISVANNINKEIYKSIYNLGEKFGEKGIPEDMDGFTADCHGVSFSYQMEGDYLLLDIEYIGYGAHGSVENYFFLFFDLRTGERLLANVDNHLPFASLFTLDGYFEFLNSRNWDDGVYKGFLCAHLYKAESYDEEDEEDLDLEILAYNESKYAKFHIDYDYNDGKLFFERESNEYSIECWATRIYEPEYYDKCTFKEVKPYLNKLGKVILNDSKSRIKKLAKSVELYKEVENNLFMEIAHYEYNNKENSNEQTIKKEPARKYVPYQIAIDLRDSDKIKGFLLYGGKKERITGYKKENEIYLKSKKSNWEYSFSLEKPEHIFYNRTDDEFEEGAVVGYNYVKKDSY